MCIRDSGELEALRCWLITAVAVFDGAGGDFGLGEGAIECNGLDAVDKAVAVAVAEQLAVCARCGGQLVDQAAGCLLYTSRCV